MIAAAGDRLLAKRPPSITVREDQTPFAIRQIRRLFVGLIRTYCKRARQTAELVALLERLQMNADHPAKPTALPQDASLAREVVEDMIAEYKSGRSTY